jgi:hypothetical protein
MRVECSRPMRSVRPVRKEDAFAFFFREGVFVS